MPMQAQRGGSSISPTNSQPGIRRTWVVNTTLRPLYPRERPGVHCQGGWVGLGAGLDCTENLAPPELDSRVLQPLASRYTDCVIPAAV